MTCGSDLKQCEPATGKADSSPNCRPIPGVDPAGPAGPPRRSPRPPAGPAGPRGSTEDSDGWDSAPLPPVTGWRPN